MISQVVPTFALVLALTGSVAFAHDAGHGGHGHGPTTFDAGEPADRSSPSKLVEIIATEADGKMSFTPSSIEVKRGQQIAFVIKNEGNLDHEFVIGSEIENVAHAAMMQAMPDMAHNDPNAVRIPVGASATLAWKFTKSGVFEFACLVPGHYEAGMKGGVAVR